MSKKVISIILGLTLTISGAAFAGCNKKDDSKAASNKITVEGKKAKEDKKAESTKDEINDPTSLKYVPKEQQNVKDYKEETQTIGNNKIKIFKGTFTFDDNVVWVGGKKFGFMGPDIGVMQIFDSSVKNAYEASISGPTEKLRRLENVTVMKMGTDDLGSKQYALINYTKPYSYNGERFHIEVCKVVKADNTGIIADNGKKYNAKDISFGTVMTELDNGKDVKKYNPNNFPKDTLIEVFYENGKLLSINRYCIIK